MLQINVLNCTKIFILIVSYVKRILPYVFVEFLSLLCYFYDKLLKTPYYNCKKYEYFRNDLIVPFFYN